MEETMTTTQIVKVFFIVWGQVWDVKSMHGVLESSAMWISCLLAVLQNLHLVANTQHQAMVIRSHGQLLDWFPQDSDQQNTYLVGDLEQSMESMSLAVSQHGAWLALDNPVSAELLARISTVGSTGLIVALNQASHNQQAHESAWSMVPLLFTVVAEESGDSATAPQVIW